MCTAFFLREERLHFRWALDCIENNLAKSISLQFLHIFSTSKTPLVLCCDAGKPEGYMC